jgi:hypothetical protein
LSLTGLENIHQHLKFRFSQKPDYRHHHRFVGAVNGAVRAASKPDEWKRILEFCTFTSSNRIVMRLRHLLTLAAILNLAAFATEAQVLNRVRNRVENRTEQKAGEEIDKLFRGKKNQKNQSGDQQGGQPGEEGGEFGVNNRSNKVGGGLISTPPDVNQNLADAEIAYKKNSYGEARHAVQQAMLGVELEIGNKILKSLPETVSGLNKEAESDRVTSTGWGWAGLTIYREYLNNNDKQFSATIANNSAWMAGVNAYLAGGGYAQQTGGQQNWKQTKLKGYRAIIEYSEDSGYRLSVPIGQSSLIVFEGINFASEPEMMKAAETFNIDAIKKELGEQ